MSYSFRMTGGECYMNPNCTSNVSGMWVDWKGRHVSELEGKKGKSASKRVLLIIAEMIINRGELESQNPKNGWGCYEAAFQTMCDLYRMCYSYPKGKLTIYH